MNKKSKVISVDVQDKIKKEVIKKSREGDKYVKEMKIARDKNTYITEVVNGRYYTERCNMIAEQINKNDIKESLDGCPKPLNMMRAEYALMKIRAIIGMRNAHFAKKDLFNSGLTEKDVIKLEQSYYNGSIIKRDHEYEEDPGKPRGKAEFKPDS